MDKWIAKVNAIIRVHFKKNPEELLDEEWAQLYQSWIYYQQIMMKAQATHFKAALTEVLHRLFNTKTNKTGN